MGEAQNSDITSIQRFGSAANLNLHKRTLIQDGVFVETTEGLQFHRLAGSTAKDLETIAHRICPKMVSHFRRKGEWINDEPSTGENPLCLEEPAQAKVYQASLLGQIFMGSQLPIAFAGASMQITAARSTCSPATSATPGNSVWSSSPWA